MTDILAQIVATKQQEVAAAQQKTPLAAIRRDAESRTQTRDFAGAIRQKITQGQAAVIAEINNVINGIATAVTALAPQTVSAVSFADGAMRLRTTSGSTVAYSDVKEFM